MKTSKLLVLALTLAGLGGCAVYTPAGYDGYGGPYATEAPVTVYGGGTISYGGHYGRPPLLVAPRGYYGSRPVGPRPHPHGGPHGWQRDQDRDGVPDRWDRDRDGDGVGNRHDRRPRNPYR